MDLHYIMKAENESGHEGVEYVTDRLEVMVPYLSILVVATVTGTVGNLLVILAVAVSKELRTVGNLFICNLAVADMLVACFTNTFTVVGSLTGESWFRVRYSLCDAVSLVCFVGCSCSLNTICAISLNRYIHICHFSKYHSIFTKWKTVGYCLMLWVLSLSEMGVSIGMVRHGYDQKAMTCVWDRTVSFAFNLLLSVVVIGTPVVVTALCYLRIYLHVYRQSKRVAALSNASKRPTARLGVVAVTPVGPSKPPEARSSKSTKIVKTLFAIFVVFVLCWSPYLVCVMADVDDTFPAEVHLFTLLFAHANSSCNSVVYGITNTQFRKGYARVLSVFRCLACDGGPTTGRSSNSTAGKNSSREAAIEVSRME